MKSFTMRAVLAVSALALAAPIAAQPPAGSDKEAPPADPAASRIVAAPLGVPIRRRRMMKMLTLAAAAAIALGVAAAPALAQPPGNTMHHDMDRHDNDRHDMDRHDMDRHDMD